MLIRDSELDYDSELVCTLDGLPFTGIAYEDSVELGRSEVAYRNGVQEGPARDWYPDGTLKGESHYVEGTLHGPSREYDVSGRLGSESHFEYGIRVTLRRYVADGKVAESEQLDPHGDEARLLERLRAERRW